MEYVGQVPAPPLDRFIDDIYCLTGVPRHRRMNIPPMPSAHLFVNLSAPVRLWDSDPSVPPAVLTDGWFMGVWTRRFLVEYPTRVRLVGVHFKPWGMSPFVDLPATDLRDRWVPAEYSHRTPANAPRPPDSSTDLLAGQVERPDSEQSPGDGNTGAARAAREDRVDQRGETGKERKNARFMMARLPSSLSGMAWSCRAGRAPRRGARQAVEVSSVRRPTPMWT